MEAVVQKILPKEFSDGLASESVIEVKLKCGFSVLKKPGESPAANTKGVDDIYSVSGKLIFKHYVSR